MFMQYINMTHEIIYHQKKTAVPIRIKRPFLKLLSGRNRNFQILYLVVIEVKKIARLDLHIYNVK